ncbi:MAG: Clp1/GlmU family protein [Anaerolineae bacterium]
MRLPNTPIEVPPLWASLHVSRWRGLVMLIGGADVGKSTLARYVCQELLRAGVRTAYLDGDPGQSTLGPPATMSLGTLELDNEGTVRCGKIWRAFIGSVSPRGHMLQMLVAASKLVRIARSEGAEAIVYDTTGFVDRTAGGLNLKWAKINLLWPKIVVAFQRRDELESLLTPLRYSRRTPVITLEPSPYVQPRDLDARRAHRAALFARYFGQPAEHTIDTSRLAVFPPIPFVYNQLLALEDRAGFVRGLGILREVRPAGSLTILSPLTSLGGIALIHPGEICVDPCTFEDRRIPY